MNKQNWIEKSHDSWSVFKIMGELVEGYEKLSELGPCVSIFGSARTQEDDPFYKQTVKIAKKIVGMGLGVITGGGPGIMEAPCNYFNIISNNFWINFRYLLCFV